MSEESFGYTSKELEFNMEKCYDVGVVVREVIIKKSKKIIKILSFIGGTIILGTFCLLFGLLTGKNKA